MNLTQSHLISVPSLSALLFLSIGILPFSGSIFLYQVNSGDPVPEYLLKYEGNLRRLYCPSETLVQSEGVESIFLWAALASTEFLGLGEWRERVWGADGSGGASEISLSVSDPDSGQEEAQWGDC